MVRQPHNDTPFGLEPNIAAGLAYLFSVVGGVAMLLGRGTNRFVTWAACQSITLFAAIATWDIAVTMVEVVLGSAHLWPIVWMLNAVSAFVHLVFVLAWLYTWIMGFRGKEIRLPLIATYTRRFFASQLA